MTEALIEERNLLAPMRDGVSLALDVVRPAGAVRVPALLNFGPYHKDGRGGRVEIRRGGSPEVSHEDTKTRKEETIESNRATSSRRVRGTGAEEVKVTDRRRVQIDETDRENRVKRLEEAALRSGSILPV